jgi:putative transcriptional regulator
MTTAGKTASKKTENDILWSVRKTVAGLHKSALVDKATLREFDALCLTPVAPLTAKEIRAGASAAIRCKA